MSIRLLTRAEVRRLTREALEAVYKDYPDFWLLTFEQGRYRPRWYTRLWRRLFPPSAVICGFTEDK